MRAFATRSRSSLLSLGIGLILGSVGTFGVSAATAPPQTIHLQPGDTLTVIVDQPSPSIVLPSPTTSPTPRPTATPTATPSPTPAPTVAPTPTATPTTTLPPAGAFAISGFGLHALDGLGSTTIVVSTSAQFLTAFGQLGNGVVDRITFQPGATLTIALGNQVRRIDGRSYFLIDGRGANVTFTGGPLWFENSHHYAVVNVRHRGGWTGGQDADNFTNAGGSHDFAYVNVSTSGFGDEGLSSTRSSRDYTYQDVLWGPGQPGHNYGTLNDGKNFSCIRCTFVGLEFRNPMVAGSGTADVVNRIGVDLDYGLSLYGTARANDVNPTNQNVGSPVDKASGATLGGFVVPAAARVVAMTTAAARTYARSNAGALPHDAFDAALVARIAP